MTLNELKRKNSVSIYRAILDGNNTTSLITKVTGICQLSVCELANELVERGILDMTKPRRNIRGRRIHHFQPSHKYFSIFIEAQDEYFTTIGITTAGTVVERFDFPLNYEGYSKQEVLDKFVIKRLKNSENYKYCMAIYLLGDENNELSVNDSVCKTTMEILIATAFSDENKLKLFDFNGTYIMSLYSHLHFPTVGISTLTKAIPFDEVCTFRGELYFETFKALEKITMNSLEKLI